MITVFGGQTSRSLRVVWLLEEMGLPYRLGQVDMLAQTPDAEVLAVNPAYYIPAMQDGEVTMVESIAIMEYLMARHGPALELIAAGLITQAAAARLESRGGHYRSDFPKELDPAKRSFVTLEPQS
jgi:glutathione S-transferase